MTAAWQVNFVHQRKAMIDSNQLGKDDAYWHFRFGNYNIPRRTAHEGNGHPHEIPRVRAWLGDVPIPIILVPNKTDADAIKSLFPESKIDYVADPRLAKWLEQYRREHPHGLGLQHHTTSRPVNILTTHYRQPPANAPMSKGPDKPVTRRDRFRAFYEWGAMGFGLISITCLASWVILTINPAGDVVMLLGPNNTIVSIRDSSIALRSGLDVTIGLLNGVTNIDPRVISERKLELPGLHYRMVRFKFNSPPGFPPRVHSWNKWALEISLLVPAISAGFLAIICLRGYRDIRRRRVAELKAKKV